MSWSINESLDLPFPGADLSNATDSFFDISCSRWLADVANLSPSPTRSDGDHQQSDDFRPAVLQGKQSRTSTPNYDPAQADDTGFTEELTDISRGSFNFSSPDNPERDFHIHRDEDVGDIHLFESQNSQDLSNTFPKSAHDVSPVTRRKDKRKSKQPIKSASRFDPKFRGVTLQMRTVPHSSGPKLQISSFFNCCKGRCTGKRRQSRQHSVSTKHGTESSSDYDEPEPIKIERTIYGYGIATGKQCASCSIRKTPLWRDAEDGTPLCNACGIRYKKYRIRCGHCWYIPKKDSKSYPNCSKCGELLRFSLSRKAW